MIVWRISNHATLDSSGGLRASGRWHSRGRRIAYCAPNPATALLEMLVHNEIDIEDIPRHYQLLKIEIPDDVSRECIALEDLPPDWRGNAHVTRELGDTWLAAGTGALLFVPCAVVPETSNTLINPAHPDSGRIRLIGSQKYLLDERLV